MSLDSRHAEARFSPNATDSLNILVAQVPRPRDMAIFVLTTTITTTTLNDNDDTTDYFTPCACAQGNLRFKSVIIYHLWNRQKY